MNINITPLSTYFAEDDNKHEAFNNWIEYLTSCCLVYGIHADHARSKALMVVFGGEHLKSLGLPAFVPSQAQANATPPITTETFAELAARYATYFPDRATPYLTTFRLHSTIQLQSETVAEFAVRLNKLARKCQWLPDQTAQQQQEQAVIACICAQTHNEKLQRQILKLNAPTTLQIVLNMGLQVESVVSQHEQLTSLVSSKTNVSRLVTSDSKPIKSANRCENCGRFHNGKPCGGVNVECYNCDTKGHFSRYCKQPRKPVKPTMNKSTSFDSSSAKRPGYLNKSNKQYQLQTQEDDFTSMPPPQDSPPVRNSKSSASNPELDKMFNDYFNMSLYSRNTDLKMLKVNTVTVRPDEAKCKSASATYELNGHIVMGTLDTGSGSSTQNYKSYLQMKPRPMLSVFNGKAIPYGSSQPIKTRGCYIAKVTCARYNSNSHYTRVLVVDVGDDILDLNTCQKLGLVVMMNQVKSSDMQPTDRPPPALKFSELYTGEYKEIDQSAYANASKNKFSKLFKEGAIGKYKYPVKLHINYLVAPCRTRHDRTEIFMRPIVATEVSEMIKLDLIEELPPNTPTTWISPIRIVPKKTGSGWRLTINMVKANKALVREQHVMMTIEDVRLRIGGAKWLTKFDLSKAYQQIEVREEDRHIMTFSTFQGLYRSKRLVFGMSPASEIFDNILDSTIAHVQNALNLSDDVLVWGDDDTHDQSADETMLACEEAGFTFNWDKCKFKQHAAEFFNRVITGFGICPTEESIRALRDAPRPNNASELKSFLGTIKWHQEYMPRLGERAEPLNVLSRQRVFEWLPEHESLFQELKHSLTATPLKHFNKDWPTRLYVDAGPKGLGAILVQIDPVTGFVYVVFFKSRQCIEVEQRYSQVEREFLVVKWALLKFRMYLKNKKFTLVTDNKPVKTMLENPNTEITNSRIQRMHDKLPKFEYDVEYIKGSDNPADFFSRNPVASSVEESRNTWKTAHSIESKINQIKVDALPPCLTMQMITEETSKCVVLQRVLEHISTAHESQQMHESVKPFKEILNDIVVMEGVLIIDGKMIIPQTLHSLIIRHCHIGHPGITRTCELLKLHAWFPRLKAQVEEYVKKCVCQIWVQKRVRLPVVMSEMPAGPMKTIAMDYKGPLKNGNMLLLIFCMYSRYVFAFEVPSTKFIHMEKVLDNLFSMFGYVLKIISDNGPPFQSADFAEYCKKRAIYHHLVTPLWPNANGMIERFMQCIEKLIQVSIAENTNFLAILPHYLLNYRATPHPTTGVSPARLFFNRDIKISIPIIEHVVKHEHNDLAELSNYYNSNKIKTYADAAKHVKPGHDFIKDDLVRITKKYSAFRQKPMVDPEIFKVLDVRGSAIAVQSIQNKNCVLIRNCYLVNFVSRPSDPSKTAAATNSSVIKTVNNPTTRPKQAFNKIVKLSKASNKQQVDKARIHPTLPVIVPWIPSPPVLSINNHEVVQNNHEVVQNNHEAVQNNHEAVQNNHEAVQNNHEVVQNGNESVQDEDGNSHYDSLSNSDSEESGENDESGETTVVGAQGGGQVDLVRSPRPQRATKKPDRLTVSKFGKAKDSYS